MRVRTRNLEQSFSNYPDTVADLFKVARHRGWPAVRVNGDEAFRRETWVQAQELGLEVRGHRLTERDRAAAWPPDRAAPKPPSHDRDGSREGKSPSQALKARLTMATQVVRALVVDPEMQARLIARAWARAAPNLENTGHRSNDRANPALQRLRDR